jgi:hypothetical protein
MEASRAASSAALYSVISLDIPNKPIILPFCISGVFVDLRRITALLGRICVSSMVIVIPSLITLLFISMKFLASFLLGASEYISMSVLPITSASLNPVNCS